MSIEEELENFIIKNVVEIKNECLDGLDSKKMERGDTEFWGKFWGLIKKLKEQE